MLRDMMHQSHQHQILGSNIELMKDNATPFTLILALYDADLALESCGWENMNRLQQCLLLQSEKINSKSSRKELLNELMNGNDSAYFRELTKKAHLRIRIKSVLARFYKECLELHSLTNVRQWNGHQLLVTFIYHLIKIGSESDEKIKKAAGHPKVWQFVEHMRKYFGEMDYNGTKFMSVFEDDKKSKGFGLLMMRQICTKYDLKSGPYSKVKKQCNTWATNLYEQSKGNHNHEISVKPKPSSHAVSVPSSVSSPSISHSDDNNKYIGTVKQIVNEQQKDSNINKDDYPQISSNSKDDYSGTYVTTDDIDDELNGKCWYWLSDYQGLRWVPYREDDVEVLNKGWRNRDKSVVIKSGTYRVEFQYDNIKEPCGNQFNNTIANPQCRVVKCEKPAARIWDMEVQKNPM